ncbi:MAG: translation initiation factor IF-2, partial [Clostridia bacterium]|nr:translation initiation factor IF-2 [Clostridia bacterium]
ADVTDIAIIVVAADDGIMPQTIEAINHAKAAEVAVIIAINKIDVRGANVDKVMQELTTHGLVPEAWGGDVVCVPVSAKTGENIDNLLDMINLTADILELKANPGRQAKGTIIEARVEKSGVIATLLVKQGTLKVGDAVISGTSTGRIKAMNNDIGQPIESAGPSVPAEILGLDEAPEAGDEFYAVDDLKTAKSLAERRKYEQFQDKHVKRSTSLEDLFAQIQEGQIKDLNIIVKGDVRGSVEAVTDSLLKISNEEVQVKVIHGAVGTITESDISLAEVSNAIIIGFNVRPNAAVTEMAKESGVDIRLYRIIYNAIEDIEAAIKGMLTPKFTEAVKGHAEAREIFKVSNVGTIAGCMVTDGKIERNSDVRVLRDGVIIFEGKLSSLKRFKDDAKEVASGYECGISVEKFNDIKQGDIFETFKMEEIVN